MSNKTTETSKKPTETKKPAETKKATEKKPAAVGAYSSKVAPPTKQEVHLSAMISVGVVTFALVIGLCLGMFLQPFISDIDITNAFSKEAKATPVGLAKFSSEEISSYVKANKSLFPELFPAKVEAAKNPTLELAQSVNSSIKEIKEALSPSEVEAAKHIRTEDMRKCSLTYLPQYYREIPVGKMEFGTSKSGRVIDLVTNKANDTDLVTFTFSTRKIKDIRCTLSPDGSVTYFRTGGVEEIHVGRAIQLIVDTLRAN